MTDHSTAGAPFRLGRALSRSFSVYFRNIVPFLMLALLVFAPVYGYQILAGPGEFAAAPADLEDYWSQFKIGPIVVFVANLFLSTFVSVALIHGTIQFLKGENASFGACFAKGTALVLPVFGVSIVYLLAILLAGLLTALPGGIALGLLVYATDASVIYFLGAPIIVAPVIYVLMLLYVTVPVAIVERAGIGSLKRSAALTKGHRWRLFGLMILFFLISGALGGALYFLGLMGESSLNFTGGMVAQWAWSGVVGAFSAVLAAVVYHDLRVAREGVDSDQIATVFD